MSLRFSDASGRIVIHKICKLARAALPESTGLNVLVQDDPDEPGRSQAVLSILLPPSITDDRVQAALRQYHERLITELPLAECRLFALFPQYTAE